MSRPMNCERTVSDIRFPSVRANVGRALFGTKRDGLGPYLGPHVRRCNRFATISRSERGEPECDFPGRGVVTVARMHQIFRCGRCEVAANGAWDRVIATV